MHIKKPKIFLCPVNNEVHFLINQEEMLPSKHEPFVSLIFAKPGEDIFLFETSLKGLPALLSFSEAYRLQATLR